jgi:hypothetical protein
MKTLTLTDEQFKALDRIISNITPNQIGENLAEYGYTAKEIKETQDLLQHIYWAIKQQR